MTTKSQWNRRGNVSVAMAMIIPEGANDSRTEDFNILRMTKTSYIRFLHMQSAAVCWFVLLLS